MAAISSKWYVLFFYVLNLIMVSVNLIIYLRNKQLDSKGPNETKAE